ncbi:MAG: SET domain-containing protein-lysine N-methyltransferase [Patescibacteria group bacterium]|jgi:hypothetical protein
MGEGIKLPFRVGISPTLHIRGLIATEDIKKGTVIERCPAVVYKRDDEHVEKTIFSRYIFDWDDEHDSLVLGYGAVLNHSYNRNVEIDFDYGKKEVVFTTIQDVRSGEELFLNYNDDEPNPIDPKYLVPDKRLKN